MTFMSVVLSDIVVDIELFNLILLRRTYFIPKLCMRNQFNALKANSNLNYIQIFRSYRAVNTLDLGCENQPASAVGK
jgi:hypothetical protein